MSGFCVASGVSISLHTYIRTDLTTRLGIPDIHRDWRVPDANVLIVVLSALFNPAFPIKFNIARVQAQLVLNLQVASASRIGAIIHTSTEAYSGPEHDGRAVCARHVEVFIGCAADGGYDHLWVEFQLEYVKTKHGKDFKYAMYEFDHPVFNGPLLLIVVCVAQGMLKGDPTLAEVLSPN